MTQGTNNQYVQSKSENGQNDHFQNRDTTTAKKVATDLGVGEKTVRRAAKFSKGVDAAEKIESGAREDTITDEDKVIQVERKNVLCNWKIVT